MALLTNQNPSVTGPNPPAITWTAASGGGDSINNASGRVLVHVRNTGGVTRVVTAATPITIAGQAVADPTFNIAAGQQYPLGPFRKDVYDDANQQVQLTYDNAAGLELAAINI